MIEFSSYKHRGQRLRTRIALFMLARRCYQSYQHYKHLLLYHHVSWDKQEQQGRHKRRARPQPATVQLAKKMESVLRLRSPMNALSPIKNEIKQQEIGQRIETKTETEQRVKYIKPTKVVRKDLNDPGRSQLLQRLKEVYSE